MKEQQQFPEDFQVTIKQLLQQMNDEVTDINQTFSTLKCCILSDLEELQHTMDHIKSNVSSYYLKAYLEPFTKHFITLTQAVQRLSEKRHGALIVIERSILVEPFLLGSIRVNAPVTQLLLESIFYPGNPLHDGGVLIRGDWILSAKNILPLTRNTEVSNKFGTRHRAAIGLSEQTDALVLVVSEETGRISFAMNGEIFPIKT
ncbi:sporulation-specific diadenylate cyclase CdaS [Bacillus carboniphilus]|uniref:Diadenylate cyclase n=1 Tax=Bacillus carboniphilus TaxID=86663 RepID=A0ABP3FXI6_9BACI